MARHNFLCIVGLLVTGLTLMLGQNADAQPKNKKTGQPTTPNRPTGATPTLPSVGPGIPFYSGGAPITNNYHMYPQTFLPTDLGASGYSSYPLAANPSYPITYAFSYYYPVYVPQSTGQSVYVPFTVFTFGDGLTMPFMPRANHEPPSPEAIIEVLMPRSDAILLVEDAKTTSTGIRRHFTSPALEPGEYTYHVTAIWNNGAKEMRADRTVRVSPGGKYFVDFNKIELNPTEK
jgi:uncharacterized protein (TIGR03000 family)